VNERLSNVLSVVVLAVVGLRLVQAVTLSRSERGRSLSRQIWTRLRWRHIWPVPFVLTGVLLVAIPLLFVPVLRWGWWSALGGDGNPIFGSSSTTMGTVWAWLIPLVFMALVLLALPLFANAEERMFRMGAQRWSTRQRVVKVLQFGLIHALIGIPIGVALALSVGGAYFMAVYLRSYALTGSVNEATLESTRAHTAYNALIILAVAVAVAIGAVA
jgi:polyferredoxin